MESTACTGGRCTPAPPLPRRRARRTPALRRTPAPPRLPGQRAGSESVCRLSSSHVLRSMDEWMRRRTRRGTPVPEYGTHGGCRAGPLTRWGPHPARSSPALSRKQRGEGTNVATGRCAFPLGSRCGRAGAWDAARGWAAESAQADFAFSQRRIHFIRSTGRTARYPADFTAGIIRPAGGRHAIRCAQVPGRSTRTSVSPGGGRQRKG